MNKRLALSFFNQHLNSTKNPFTQFVSDFCVLFFVFITPSHHNLVITRAFGDSTMSTFAFARVQATNISNWGEAPMVIVRRW